MKLTKEQLTALKEFKLTGYVLIDSYRRGGKTFFLREIINMFPFTDIGIFCPSYMMFRHLYSYMPRSAYLNFNKLIIIGDEYVLSPHADKKIACAITGLPRVNKWLLKNNKFISKSELKNIKKQLTKEFYMKEFGKYK